MAVIRPFCCIHPAKGMEPEIAALPYDVYHREDAREAVLGKPLSFLNIDRPETMFPPEQDMYAPEVYEAGSKRFWKMRKKRWKTDWKTGPFNAKNPGRLQKRQRK